jgi:secreted Zn-dependent insulinase-like peptidase
MQDYESFYTQIWSNYIMESDVSFDYRETNVDFIRTLTFNLYKDYERNNVSISVYGKMLKVFFTNLFLYSPSTIDDGDIRDFNKEY